jgi:DNA-binding NarL/FixJ family response regulator
MECQLALGGEPAIQMGAAWLPDLIVMDVSMPAPNGIEATHALRKGTHSAGTLFLAFTALDETEVARHLSRAASDGYCQKGQSPHVLVALINTFLATR